MYAWVEIGAPSAGLSGVAVCATCAPALIADLVEELGPAAVALRMVLPHGAVPGVQTSAAELSPEAASTYAAALRRQEVLAAAYELEPDVVAEDTALVSGWTEGADDLLRLLQVRRGWTAGYAADYLTGVRRTLLGLMPGA
jgi:hypothetical protein